MKQGKWEMYTRGTIYLQRFAMAIRAIERDTAKRLLISPIGDLLFINVGSKLWFAWNKKEIHLYGETLLNIIRSPKKFQKHYFFLVKQCQMANREAEKIRKLNLQKQSNSQLIKLSRHLYDVTGKIQILLGADVDSIDLVFENSLQKQLEKELGGKLNSEEFLILYKKLSSPVHTTYITQQHRDILRAALSAKNISAAAWQLEKKYWWVPLGWENISPHTAKYFINQIERERKRRDIKSKLLSINGQEQITEKRRNGEIKKYHLSKQFQSWLTALDRYARLHDLRKEMQVRNVYAFHQLLEETARRFKLNAGDLEWTWYEEAQGLLAGKKIDHKEISRRKQAIYISIEKHKMHFSSGATAIKEKNKILKISRNNISEIKGLGATGGVARGRVKICSGYEEALKKVRIGDILVTGMTLPDCVPAMRKAAAIVTDEGGITCHAAIVSRELGKVCVVGTKIATQVFKDGDLVEVDADKGIITKII